MKTLLVGLILCSSSLASAMDIYPGVAAGSIDTAKLAAGAVDTGKILTDAVTPVKLLSDSGGLAKVTGQVCSVSGSDTVCSGAVVSTGTSNTLKAVSGNVSAILAAASGGSASLNLTRNTAADRAYNVYSTLGVPKWFAGMADNSVINVGLEYFIGETATGANPHILLNPGGYVGIGKKAPYSLSGIFEVGASTFTAYSNGMVGLASFSVATLQNTVPSTVGQMAFCNNCSPAKMVVSTGTSAGQFADINGGEFK